MMRDIYEEIGEPAALELVAEEAAELAQACLKLSRILRGENPTPVPEALAAEKVMEEAADVQTALSVLSSAQWYNEDYVLNIQWGKSDRWRERLRKREEGNGQDGDNTENDLVKKQGDLVKDLVDDTGNQRGDKVEEMNKQRKVLITITYNEMGIIIDTKAEEVAQPNLQPTCDQLATDCISRQPGCEDAVSRDALDILIEETQTAWLKGDILLMYPALKKGIQKLPPVTPKQPRWIPVTERLPENEHDVLVTVEIRPVGRKPFRRVVRAFYTDGKHTDADSAYTWYDLEEPDFDDDGNIIVPEGWWESSDYSEEVSQIDDFVISWREQPKPQKGEGNG